MKFRKKPVVIEAVQVSKRMDITSPRWLAKAITRNDIILHGMGKFARDMPWAEIHTSEGLMRGDEGDWIIRGVAGELYPCKPNVFAKTYEPADAAPTSPAQDDEALEALRLALDALTCGDTGDDLEDSHRCSHCDEYVDRNGPIRQRIRALLAKRGEA